MPGKWASERFGVYDLRNYLDTQDLELSGWPGQCALNPIEVEARSDHCCGQHQLSEVFEGSWWDFCRSYELGTRIDLLQKELKAERLKAKAARKALREERARNREIAGARKPRRSKRPDVASGIGPQAIQIEEGE